MSQDKNILTTLAAPGLPRRAVLSGIVAAAGSVAIVAGAAAASGPLAIAADPMVDLLRKRQAMMDAANSLPKGAAEGIFDSMLDAEVAFEKEHIVGTPVQSMLGAFLALDAVQQQDCNSATDEWLIRATRDFLAQRCGEANLAGGAA
jgi:hypothetical protein